MVPSRIQLMGCYAHYEEDGPENENELGIQSLHKSCGQYKVKRNSGFEEMKYAAFLALESGVSSGNGFCDMNYESFHLTAECAANLRGCDCGECVSNALQICEEECGNSVSGEIYLDGCFISYEYYVAGGTGRNSFEDNGTGGRTPKLVAIVIGAAILSGAILFFFIKSFRKKRDVPENSFVIVPHKPLVQPILEMASDDKSTASLMKTVASLGNLISHPRADKLSSKADRLRFKEHVSK
ncbi:Plasmodesmata-located protein 2 [Dorcoceras hygrometricum]|uniref:Plasmodesmata-located protein 2 n=1 Tax=Dorcoceras hygrometricum TaxID=472368 RepID=A0A2Z7C4T0_9LAMI|nr:Plasmodesmata-located protein 2 [Dorcoceras hygrometricum]